jgi:hypothetical protein
MAPKVAPMATRSSALQKTSPNIAGRNRTAAHCFPKRASNGSIKVVNLSRLIRPAKKSPPRMRLMPKQSPPCTPEARLER